MDYKDIPQYLTNQANYKVDIFLDYFEQTISNFIKEDGLELNPDFQRGHVWCEEQQIAFVEHILRGGKHGRDLYFNYPSWHLKSRTGYNDFVCVDGLQRITALLRFLRDEIKVFGHYKSEFTGKTRSVVSMMEIHINDLQKEEDVLQWYIEMNSGGTPHTEEEINKVRRMLERKRGRNGR